MHLTSFTTKALVAGVTPMFACSTYYTLEKLENASSTMYLATSLACPIMLLGFIGIVQSLTVGNKSKIFRGISGLALALPAILLASIWL